MLSTWALIATGVFLLIVIVVFWDRE